MEAANRSTTQSNLYDLIGRGRSSAPQGRSAAEQLATGQQAKRISSDGSQSEGRLVFEKAEYTENPTERGTNNTELRRATDPEEWAVDYMGSISRPRPRHCRGN